VRIQVGDITFDDDSREVARRGEVLHLSPKAFHLLQFLIARRPNAVAKDDLIETVWPDVVVEEANLKNLVVEIRRTLGVPELIRTVRGFGYAFAADASASERADPVAMLLNGDQIYRLAAGENLIGRGEGCSTLIHLPGVSRHHARITISASGDAQVEDAGSKNGTWLNGVRLAAAAPLRSGDRIGIGVTLLVYRTLAEEDSTVSLNSVRQNSSR
jgi:DNA-binding winged helix-turn-helix (wHTH) protein